MNELMARFWIFVVKSLAHTSVTFRARVARVLAWVLWHAIPKRRHVTLTNLRVCFPDWCDERRLTVAKSTYFRIARAALDHGVLWAGSGEEVDALVRFEGLETITNDENRPLVVIAPHFVGLDAAGIGLNRHVRGVSLYQKQSNAAWDRAAFEGRKRFSDPVLIAKSGHNEDLKQVIRAMRDGMPFYYLPDMDHGIKNSIFVPFFGVPAATLTMASRLARLTRAKVCMCIAEMTDDGYVVHLSELWEEFPTSNAEADTIRVTQELERWIEKLPDQYLWTHRRFKTRPEGEPGLY